MTPYRMFPEPVEVTVAITQPRYPVAGSFPGFAYGWRGARVYVEFRTGVGEKRFGWLDAGLVRRSASDSQLAQQPAFGAALRLGADRVPVATRGEVSGRSGWRRLR